MIKHSVFLTIVIALLVCWPCIDSSSAPHSDQPAVDEIPPEFAGGNAVILSREDWVEIKGNTAIHKHRTVKKILVSGHPEESVFNVKTDKYRKLLDFWAQATYPDGSEVELTEEDVLVIPDFGEYVLYSDTKTHALRFPGAGEGTVIEMEWKRKIKNLVYWEPVVFQGDIPILEQRYTLICRDDLEFSVHGSAMSEAPTTQRKLGGGRIELVWERRDTPAFEPEEMMPPEIGFVPVLWFCPQGDLDLGADLRLDSWAGVVKWYEKLSRKSLKSGSRLEAVIASQGASATTERERAEALFGWVQSNLRYVAIYLGLDGFRPHKTEDILENRYGDCKDKSVVLAAALREVGIEAWLTMVRTSDLGTIENALPSPGYFNHLIVQAIVDGDTTWLDPTCGSCSFGMLPSGDQGADALVVRDGEASLTTLPSNSPRPNRWDVSARVSLLDNGDASITTTLELDGYYASAIRNRLTHRGGKSKRDVVIETFGYYLEDATIETIDIEGDDISADFLSIELVCGFPGLTDPNRTVSFVRAILHPVYFDLPDCDDRRFPVDLGYPRTRHYAVEFELSDGWEVPEVPESGRIASGPLSYMYEWTSEGNKLGFSRTWTIGNGTMPPAGCADIRDALEAVASIEKSKFLVKKASISSD